MVREIILIHKIKINMAKLYEFTLNPVGWGDTLEEAWDNCKESYDIEKEGIPEKGNYEIIDEQ